MIAGRNTYRESLAGRVFPITGAARGLGPAMSLGAAREGVKVMLADLDPAALLELQVSGALRNPAALTQVCDVSDFISRWTEVTACWKRFGRMKVLVNNAGRGPNYVTHCAAPHRITQRLGRIINISASLATMYRFEGSPYGASRAAIQTQTMIFARHLAGSDVTMNALLPGGAVASDFVSPLTCETTPAGRTKLLDPQITVDPLLWLASNASSELSGARLVASRWAPESPIGERTRHALENPILRGSESLSGDKV